MTDAQYISIQFSILCGNLFIDENLALENPRVRQQLTIKEPIEDKIKNLQNVLESEF